jgi:hypothetical protein
MATDLGVQRSSTAPVIATGLDTSTADRIIVVSVWLAIAAALGEIVTQVVDFAVYDLRIGALNSDVHMSIFGILSLAAQAAAVAAVAVRFLLAPRRTRTGWLTLGALVLILLAVRTTMPDDPIALLVPVGIAAVLFWRLTADDYQRARVVVMVALLLLAISYVIHIVGPRIIDALGYGYGTWPYEIKALSKHITELSGWILLSAGIFAGGLVQSGGSSWRALRSRSR